MGNKRTQTDDELRASIEAKLPLLTTKEKQILSWAIDQMQDLAKNGNSTPEARQAVLDACRRSAALLQDQKGTLPQ